MKRLLVVAVVVMLSTSAVGCGCRPWGYWWRRAMCCDSYGTTVGASVAPVMTYSDPYTSYSDPYTSYGDPYLEPAPTIETVPGPIAN